jgi:hypothetical protein
MSDAAGGPPSSTPGGQQGQPPSDVQAGYTDPDQQEKQQELEARADEGMNQSIATQFRLQQQQQNQINATAAKGGFVMDTATMHTFAPQWQSVADDLEDLRKLGVQFRALRAPAIDDGSGMQKKAADAHADAYDAGIISQRDYAQNYADSFTKTIAAYENQDQAAQDAARKSGEQS